MPSNVLDFRCRPANSPLMIISSQEQQKETKVKEKCPRCESRDTKFCYYNNYNTSQPRHFCRSCRRYWTLGGSLRNVPIGGSARNKRLRPNPPPSSSTPDNCHVSVAQLMAAAVVSPFDHPPFCFDLGLGLGSMMKARPDPSASSSASMEDVGFGVGPASLAWPLDTWRVVNGAGVSGECGGGPTNGEVH